MYEGKNRKKHSHISRYTLVLAILAALLLVGGVFAGYIYSNGGNFLLSAKEFYFTSNLLKANSAEYILNSNTTEVSFTLGNHADKLRFSQDDIRYSIEVEKKYGIGDEVNVYADGAEVTEESELVLNGNGIDTAQIRLEGLEIGETYTVIATGRAGYKKILRADFTVSDEEENVYAHLDTSNDAFVLLTVWTENVKGTLNVEVTERGLIPDSTDPVLREVYNYNKQDGYYEPMTVAGDNEIRDTDNFTAPYASYTYRFFRGEDKSYDIKNSFNVFIEDNGKIHPANTDQTP